MKRIAREDQERDFLGRTSAGKLARAVLVYELAGEEGAAVLKKYCQQWTRDQSHQQLTGTEWLELLRKRQARYESVVNAAREDPDHPVRVSAWRTVNEYRLALWLQTENCKGIAVPTGLLAQQYMNLFGMGPHGPYLSSHLNTFLQQKSTKHWLTRWRKTWGIKYAKCARAAPVATSEIEKKAGPPSPQKKNQKKRKKVSGFETRFLEQKTGPATVTAPIPKSILKNIVLVPKTW